MIPGEYILRDDEIVCNDGRKTFAIEVLNVGDRPIQVGSHFHFYEVNRALQFNREAVFGMHLNVPSGAAVRFEPGDVKEVELVPFAGERKVYGLNNLTEGSMDERVLIATNYSSPPLKSGGAVETGAEQ
ncbi:urease subunit beta [Paenibacillus apiarius]|uniref:Urease subunit beta n=1 Tax=Paenibacillus apiarius TaxID=46240 RepID=A0ABT4DXE2_9BACL|nr:urease subunit beta [Paenibacillus apiarius]MCY9513211.1 urease subunit beta [Paenibacillus apiarius]MCY9521430.1 urease subunit beta [Paenibacillus apiarius]MCY9554424.1 urease subunit beta [Paenibacillus apiarius]MCY9560627.1 urease subunit beta [Paenibacillus apiarius]MCY9685122.1 urease subunit beta [Paenibacillus apiarius]